MGVMYSSDSIDTSRLSLDDTAVTGRQYLRIPLSDVTKLVEVYNAHAFQPMIDMNGLRSLFMIALNDRNVKLKGTSFFFNVDDLIDTIWIIFEHETNQICYTQEILACLIVLVDCPWSKRLSLLFDTFKCMGVDAIGHDEIVLLIQSVASSLCRLWKSSVIDYDELSELSLDIAKNALLKLGKDMEDYIGREQFIMWASDRFRDSKTIASVAALLTIYSVVV